MKELNKWAPFSFFATSVLARDVSTNRALWMWPMDGYRAGKLILYAIQAENKWKWGLGNTITPRSRLLLPLALQSRARSPIAYTGLERTVPVQCAST